MRDRKKRMDWRLLVSFSIDDFRTKYAGSLMGMAWAFVQPVTTILLYWFVFQVAFDSEPVADCPFILWLVSGILPWFFFSEAVSGTTPALVEYGYLVKKVVFPVDILLMVRILSCFLVQLFLAAFAVLFFSFFGYFPDLYYLQLPYYMAYLVLLAAGIGYCAAALYPFFRDLLQIVNIALQILFWMTPIVWNLNRMPGGIGRILEYNPLFYAVEGYRDVFVYKEFFWADWKMAIYYWAVAILFFLAGKKIFQKMKVHFADVL